MKTLLLNILAVAAVVLCNNTNVYAQNDVYATSITDSSADFRDAHKITDSDPSNFAYLSNTITLLSTSYLKLHFPVSGQAGDVVSLTIQSTGQLLGASLLDNITVRLYDSLGNNVANANGSSILQLSLLTNAGNIYALRFLTNPTLNFKFKDARIEFNNLLSASLFSEFRIYNAFYSKPCPVVVATSVNAYGTNTLLTGYVTNAGNAVDNDPNTAARMTVPLNLLSILPPAYIDLGFNSKGGPGEFVGFTVREASALLSLSLLQNLSITVYDDNGNTVVSQSGFTIANLKLLAGYSDRYMIGVVTPNGNYRIAHVKLTLNGALNLLEDVDVYNAFHYRITRPPVTIVASGPTNVCNGGSITLTAVDSTGGTGFLWSTGATTPSITVAATGVYSVSVTDTVSCSKASLPLKVTILPPLMPVVTGDTVICRGSNGVLRTAATYSAYQWQNNSTAATFNVTAAGKYFVKITDAYNCQVTDTVVVKYNDIQANPAITNAKCSNSADGAINLNITNGGGSYSYLWSTGATTVNIGSVPAGLYTCIITDNTYHCTYDKAFTVAAATTLSTRSVVINTSNADRNDAVINLEVIGGTTYNYLWSNGATTSSLQNLAAGLYTVNITDIASGCIIKDSINIDNGNNGLTIVPTVINANGCKAASGSISLNVSGGTGSYGYQWSNGASTAGISTLVPGTYYVTVTDNNTTLKKAIEVNVGINNLLNVSGTSTSPACNSNTGAVSLSVTNGTGNYSYKWNTGATTADITSLQPGVYVVKVTDNTNGCIVQKIFDVKSVTPAATLAAVQPLCNTNTNGRITLNNIVGNYMYKWSNGATTKDISNLLPGIYNVVINDSLTGCTAIYTTVIKERPQVQLSFTAQMNAACFAPYTGGVSTMATGGTMPYTYAWASGGNAPGLSNVQGGSYTITVNDANACSNSATIMIGTDSTDIVAAILDSITSVNCIKANSGQIYVHAERGTGPYTYAWSNGSSSEDLTDIAAGNYALVITDNKGCKDSLQAMVNMVPALTLTKTVTDIKCYGGSDGAITVTAGNGSGNYQYAWSTSATNAQLNSLVAGTYTIKVTDVKTGCSKTDIITLSQPETLQLEATAINATCLNNDGKITLSATGGIPPYNYYRENIQIGNSLTGLISGAYSLTVKDNNGCNAEANALISKNCDADINVHDVITPNGDGANDVLVIEGILAYPGNELQIFNKWGDVVFTQKGYNNNWTGDDKKNSPLPGGTYYYVLKLNAKTAGVKDSYTGYITIQR
jgi:gliding motility-associated-like protein